MEFAVQDIKFIKDNMIDSVEDLIKRSIYF